VHGTMGGVAGGMDWGVLDGEEDNIVDGRSEGGGWVREDSSQEDVGEGLDKDC